MGITSTRLFDLKLIDGIIEEPLGGAHRDLDQVVSAVGEQLSESLAELSKLDSDSLLARRRARLQEFGTYTEK
jgi:acetyl-CoA carboxylase carboxyl transferase subunit alpha